MGAEHLFDDRQRAFVERPRRREVALGLKHDGEVVETLLQAAGQETSGLFMEKTTTVLSNRLRAYATRLLVLETFIKGAEHSPSR
jgi:hypothetical protein